MFFRHAFLGSLVAAVLCTLPARAETPGSPVRFLPREAELVVQASGPRQLVEAVTSIELFQKVQGMSAAREYLDSTNVRRFYQLIQYFEREMGSPWPELVDQIAGGGAALGIKLGDNSPVLVAIQGTDEKKTRQFVDIAVKVVTDELERQGNPERPRKVKYKDFEGYQLGKDAHLARVGSALLFSNKEEALKKSLDLVASKGQSMADHPGLKGAAKLLPSNPLATLWIDMDRVRKTPGGEALYTEPREPFVTIVLGGWASIATRAKFFTAGLYREEKGFHLTFRMPSGRDDMGADRAVNVPAGSAPGSRPLLEPKGVLYSTSFFWDLSGFWTERLKLFGEKNAKGFEDFNKSSGQFLSNFEFSKLISQAGPYHRLVVAHQDKGEYTRQPKTLVPAAAFINEMRKPDEFSKAVEIILRGVGLLGSTQLGLKMVEEEYKGCKIVGYRFPEKRELKEDTEDLRFNATPCFVRVGNQFVASSTMTLARELVDLLQAEAKQTSAIVATSQTRIYAEGGSNLLRTFEDQLITQTILAEALPVAEARKQVEEIIALVKKTGGLSLQTTYAPHEFHLDIRLQLSK